MKRFEIFYKLLFLSMTSFNFSTQKEKRRNVFNINIRWGGMCDFYFMACKNVPTKLLSNNNLPIFSSKLLFRSIFFRLFLFS